MTNYVDVLRVCFVHSWLAASGFQLGVHGLLHWEPVSAVAGGVLLALSAFLFAIAKCLVE